MSLIEARNLHQRFGTKEVLKGVTLTLQKGEILAIIGPTGAGKTSLLRLLCHLEEPSSGKIFFEGREVTSRLRTEVRRKMSMVMQKPVVFNASVYDNVAYPLRIRRYEKRIIPGKVDFMLKRIGLDGYQKRNARTLSGGETQKVALARALITDPQVLLLDEPTANLDPASLRTIEDLIQRSTRENGMATVIATHEMAQGHRLADRIGVMMDGELIQIGRLAEIFYTPSDIRVARFVEVQNILKGRIIFNEGGLARIRLGSHDLEAITDRPPGEEVHMCIRPEDIVISSQPSPSSARNSFEGYVKAMAISGPLARVEIDCGFTLVSLITSRSAEEIGLRIGQTVYATFKATALHVIGRADAG